MSIKYKHLGKLITCDGPDGGGKSTQLKILAEYLKAKGYDVITSREPGGTPLGEELRKILLGSVMSIDTEIMLFAAIRAEHMAALIKPAIVSGKIIVCDRFSDSTFAYQGCGRGRERDVELLEEFVLDGFEPHYTLFFDVTLEESNKRISSRNVTRDRFEKEQIEFKKRVYHGYLLRYLENPHRMHRIDANKPLEDVSTDVKEWVDNVFIPGNPIEQVTE